MTANVNDAGAHQTDSNEISDRQLPELLAFILIAAFVCAVVAVAAYWYWFGSMSVVSSAEAWGQLGDFFGGVLNPAFSFLTLFGLLLTLAVQSKELKLARQVASDSKEALVLSQKEMEKSARALEAQISATQHQRFDQSFFSWLDSYRKRVEYEERKEPLDLLWNNFLSESRIVKFCAQSGWQGEVGFEKEQLATRAKREAIFRAVLAASSAGYASIQARFGPAFQSLNFMLHWVWSQPSNIIPPEEKLRYANIVRAQLSQAELVWLFVGYQLGKVPLESEIVEATGLFWHASLDLYPAIKLILEFGKPSGYDLVELP